ncbi:MAG: 1-acyl-sn-glycerol-3-phosphate acyltransferase [Alphaproteobacteria bacterium]|nr:1-acyl-sn-glycerol-3-phosphate acyltransferase [Alphaproteobacteria bacterium]MCL2889975.1 1-acyl-sn-glycerol-3-phosphate acyltransferase [Alphaproteobacteria bacterium]
MLRTFIFYVAFALFWIGLGVLHLFALPSRHLTRKLFVLNAMGLLWLARVITGIKYEIHMARPEPDKHLRIKSDNNHARSDGKAIIAAKHMSILESAVLIMTVPNAFFIIKRELMWIPIFGWAAARIGYVPVNRNSGTTNMKKLLNTVAKKIIAGDRLIIYPEGTRAAPGAPVKLRRGLLFIAESLKLPIQPVGTDSGLYWPKRGIMRPGTANVWFEPMLPYNATLEQISDAIGRYSA